MTPNKKRESVAVAAAPAGAQAIAVIPNSSQYVGFIFLVSDFNPGKDFEIQGSFDGTAFFKLDPDAFVLGVTHFTSSATPLLIQLGLYAPLPGGIRIASVDSDLTLAGTVDCMMLNSPYNWRN
jgi:hypothetical protein